MSDHIALRTYQTNELEHELERRSCVQEGHPPFTVVTNGASQAIFAWCRCGAQRWEKISG